MTVRRDGAVVHRGRPAAVIAVAVCGVLAAGWSVVAASSTDVQANSPQVATEPDSDSTATFPTNKQNEPTIAVNPISDNLIAGSNDEQEQPACGAAIRGTDDSDCGFFPVLVQTVCIPLPTTARRGSTEGFSTISQGGRRHHSSATATP